MSLEHLWAGWRSEYVATAGDDGMVVLWDIGDSLAGAPAPAKELKDADLADAWRELAGADAPRIVGAVTAITGTGRLQVTLKGQPDHSGTTPMLGRRDALLGAAEVALALREMAI